MVEVIFNYEGIDTTIQCDINDKMKDIIGKLLNKISEKEDNLCYLYNGNKLNYELSFNEQANDVDKIRKKMNVIVNKTDDKKNEKKKLFQKI